MPLTLKMAVVVLLLSLANQLPAQPEGNLLASASTPATSAAVENDRDFREAQEVLKSRYADPAAIADGKSGSNSLAALLNRLSGGAVLMTQPMPAIPSNHQISSELLGGKIGYLRMPTFKPAKSWTQLENQILEWQRLGIVGIIIDVRSFEAVNDFEGASRVASIFVPPGETLFTVQGLQIPQQVYRSSNASNRKPLDLPLIVLTNRGTSGASEVLTSVLRAYGKAIIVGRSTAGRAGLFAEARLSSGRYLWFATGQAMMGDGTPLFGKPVIPDIALYIDDRNERLAMEEGNQGSAARLVQELPSRARTSESALVHEETPELDEMISEQLTNRKPETDKDGNSLQDVALIRAMDALRAIEFAQNQAQQSRAYLTTKK